MATREETASVYQQALTAVALLAGFAGLVSTTGLVLAEQYAWLILPVSFLSGLGLVVVGVVSDRVRTASTGS